MSALRVSAELSLPREAATWVISYLAKRGAGKTYCSSVQAEEMLKAAIPIVVVDGMGIWWGLRVSSDGLHEGLPVVVFGGEHADLPLVPEKATEMARAVVESNISCVLDLSPFSKYVARKIVSSFLNELYRLNRVERHVFIEESDLWAPQRPIGQEEALCLSSVDNFVRRGGNHNLGCTLITQRSAVLNKDILTQSDCLVVLRTLAPQDKKAIQSWVEEQTEEDKSKLNQWYDSLKTLENGEAWVWHPEKPSIFQKVKFRKRETFHATREFIRSPRASKITLMAVGEFIERFKKVFESDKPVAERSATLTVSGTVNPKLQAEIGALRTEVEEFRSGRKLSESIQEILTLLENENRQLREDLKNLDTRFAKLQKENEAIDKIREGFKDLGLVSMPVPISPEGKASDREIGLQATTTIVDVAAAEKLVTVNTESIPGKILFVAKKGKLDSWRQLGEIVKAVEEERWTVSPQQINNALNDMVKESLIAKRHTDRNYYCLAQGVRFAKEDK